MYKFTGVYKNIMLSTFIVCENAIMCYKNFLIIYLLNNCCVVKWKILISTKIYRNCLENNWTSMKRKLSKWNCFPGNKCQKIIFLYRKSNEACMKIVCWHKKNRKKRELSLCVQKMSKIWNVGIGGTLLDG